MGLKSYREKRDFKRTPEPAGRRAPSSSKKRLYVIQKHAATRLHYDLRLEDGGVLKSWAVPKGPSLDPKEKRLAVQVEDHPIEYGAFEGVIPKGEYGAGTVLLWDRGRWIPEGDPAAGLRSGKLKFTLDGDKLKGGWTLVRLRNRDGREEKPNWLLIKERDDTAASHATRDILSRRPESVASKRRIEEIARARDRVWHSNRDDHGGEESRVDPSQMAGAIKSALPSSMKFQLATLTDEPPEGDEWMHEIKLDGFRMQCRIKRGAARLFTRTGQDWTHRFRHIAETAASLSVHAAIFDGEIVALAPDGRSSFQLLQQHLNGGHDGPVVYYLFDLLYLDGYDLSPVPLEVRKQVLQQLLSASTDASATLRYSDHVVGNGEAFYREACRLGLEGMIAKRRAAESRPGRGRDWIKVKCIQKQEFVVAGFTRPAGSRQGFGALLIGVYEGEELRYVGRVGTGFNDRLLAELRARLGRLRREQSPFSTPVPGSRGVTWVRPELVIEVAFAEWTADGVLRHPSFQGIREDKPAREVRRERPQSTEEVVVDRPKRASKGKPESKPKDTRPPAQRGVATRGGVEVAGVRLTNPARVLYPEQGLTKRDLAVFYETIADWILPHLAGRPLMIVRCPEGHAKNCFYQKHMNETVPAAVKSVEIEEDDGTVRYLMVDDLQGLVSLAQMGVLELHVWGARAARIETPDRMVFDLDPDVGLEWKRVVDAASLVRRRLADAGLKSWVKTTGGKGLHVVVPLSGKQNWDEVKGFSQAVAERLAAEAPDRYTSKMSKAGRKGKIFIDYLRNGRGATAVAAYSTRARAGAPVSVPITWEELETIDPRELTIATVPPRLAAVKRDPWKDLWNMRQSITRAARLSVKS